MNIFHKYILVFLLFPLFSFSQSDTTGKVKYTGDYLFNEGIYKSFLEFKTDNPSITKFTVKKPTPLADPNFTILNYQCPDSSTANGECEMKNCWGYCYRGEIYISHLYHSYFFKLLVIGSVCHFAGLAVTGSSTPMSDIHEGFGAANKYQQFFFDFDTGEMLPFNYKYFSAFLQQHDNALSQQLENESNKRKVIFKYLLKYNAKHPIWFKS
ncbi:MAG: hypothetical protein ABR968_11975 [Bacteroidales bacterium]|jgi:hypothetical protein